MYAIIELDSDFPHTFVLDAYFKPKSTKHYLDELALSENMVSTEANRPPTIVAGQNDDISPQKVLVEIGKSMHGSIRTLPFI